MGVLCFVKSQVFLTILLSLLIIGMLYSAEVLNSDYASGLVAAVFLVCGFAYFSPEVKDYCDKEMLGDCQAIQAKRAFLELEKQREQEQKQKQKQTQQPVVGSSELTMQYTE